MNSKKTRKINTDIHERVLRFISLFKGAEDPFLHGCCYWFAAILEARFKGSVLYASPPGHFVCQILNRLYDVTGDVTEAYDYFLWRIWRNMSPACLRTSWMPAS